MAKRKQVNPDEMSFLDHLEELRWHLIRATLAIVIVGTVAFIFKDFIFDQIIFAPARPDFISYDLLCQLANIFGSDKGCINEMDFEIQNRTMGGQFNAAIWTSIIVGLVVAFPYVIYEFWRFISPGLYEKERKNSRGFIIISSLLFFMGVLFGYYVIAPLSINFLANFTVGDVVKNQFDIGSYIGLVRASAIAAGLIFELPIIIYFFTKIGLVTPQFLRKYRKYALVIVLIVSAIITPPDISTQVIVSIPILILYEVSIFISAFVMRKELKEQNKIKKKQA
ncbi:MULTISPECIES: twin-arginine translocase subunit TatC [unclassified Leeuwenhoekiella]|uniref:twin-arginine translocase subunit TatC n=1 Tax=unclassified Leeuwenhoekiella TaxID=2615029 RepID=UPI000C5AD8F3|nr:MULTISPECIES: twin-arginine translocase subunit TatC [unclassified Leeuwenhoekiella]MAW96645.1 twin-arginine translocase subunit TatC [Leeuwenhoekiella sp.]MBA81533.1 twin-arginine translocase subunit TatC [Leeuwenhoekiella sp.]|tara:strand:- start:7291 stop:8133 length:843 start_codon:yes stop_codon:yes gene_type:complete